MSSMSLGAPIIIYLAGGMRTAWRDKVRERFTQALFLDPTKHGLEDEKFYTVWDLAAIARSEIVFAYMEADNPSGLGLMLEIGYAFAMDKTIIFVNEKTDMTRYFGMARTLANGAYTNFDEGLDGLENILYRYIPEAFSEHLFRGSTKEE